MVKCDSLLFDEKVVYMTKIPASANILKPDIYDSTKFTRKRRGDEVSSIFTALKADVSEMIQRLNEIIQYEVKKHSELKVLINYLMLMEVMGEEIFTGDNANLLQNYFSSCADKKDKNLIKAKELAEKIIEDKIRNKKSNKIISEETGVCGMIKKRIENRRNFQPLTTKENKIKGVLKCLTGVMENHIVKNLSVREILCKYNNKTQMKIKSPDKIHRYLKYHLKYRKLKAKFISHKCLDPWYRMMKILTIHKFIEVLDQKKFFLFILTRPDLIWRMTNLRSGQNLFMTKLIQR